MAGEFDKDFGYLIPFLDKIAAAAGSLSNTAAREELKGLIAGEKERWTRIRDLLAGGSAAPAAPGVTATSAKPAAPPPAAEAPAFPQFTVGSLKGRSAGVKGAAELE